MPHKKYVPAKRDRDTDPSPDFYSFKIIENIIQAQPRRILSSNVEPLWQLSGHFSQLPVKIIISDDQLLPAVHQPAIIRKSALRLHRIGYGRPVKSEAGQ